LDTAAVPAGGKVMQIKMERHDHQAMKTAATIKKTGKQVAMKRKAKQDAAAAAATTNSGQKAARIKQEGELAPHSVGVTTRASRSRM